MKDSNFLHFIISDPVIFTVMMAVTFSGFLFGYDQGVISNVVTQESFGAHFPRVYSDSGYKGWCVSTFLLCSWLGSLLNAPLNERLGRRDTISYVCIIFLLGAALQTAGTSDAVLFAGRGIAGLAIGSLSTTGPIFLSEMVPPQFRGGLIVCQQLLIALGILVAYWLGYGVHFIGGTTCAKNPSYTTFDPYKDVPAGGCDGQSTASWRIPLGFQMLPGLCLGLVMLLLPRSPRWLLSQGREEESWKTLQYLRRKFDPEEIEHEFLEMKGEVLFEKGYSERKFGDKKGFSLEYARYVDLLTTKSHFKRVFIGSAVMFFQQFIGVNAIVYYAPTIFLQLGLSSNTTSLLGTGLYGAVTTVATVPAVFLIDRVGRRPLLMAGAAGTFISLIVVAGIVGKYGGKLDQYVTAGRTAIAFIFIFGINFSYSWAPVGWVLPAEIFPVGIRAKAVSITTSATWMSNFIIGLVTPSMLDNMKWGTYLFFAIFALIAFAFTYYVIPETKGKPLEEMDAVFNDIEVAEEKQAFVIANGKGDLLDSASKPSIEHLA